MQPSFMSSQAPNNGMELTVQSGTVPAKRRAGPAPLWPAAHPRRSPLPLLNSPLRVHKMEYGHRRKVRTTYFGGAHRLQFRRDRTACGCIARQQMAFGGGRIGEVDRLQFRTSVADQDDEAPSSFFAQTAGCLKRPMTTTPTRAAHAAMERWINFISRLLSLSVWRR